MRGRNAAPPHAEAPASILMKFNRDAAQGRARSKSRAPIRAA
jgi:hypothetical protein